MTVSDFVEIEFEGRRLEAETGQSVAAALLSRGYYDLRLAEDGTPRGVLCGIGVCWECRCIINGKPNSRACMIEVQPGMTVRRQRGLDY